MLLNLLSNAIKFTPNGGTISFRVIEKPSSSEGVANFEFQIKDNGIGMKPEYKDKIFDAFTREETLLAPRVRMDARYGTPSFFWERTVRHAYPLTARQPQKTSRTRTYTAYIPRKGSRQKEKMRVYLLSKHIPVVKKTSSVPDSVFDSEPAWAQTAAHLIEPELTELRKQAKAVSRLSQAVMRASAAFAKNTL